MNETPAPKRLVTTYIYFGILVFLMGLASPSGYLTDISTSFMLKNQLHLGPSGVALFRVITGAPGYVGFIFGLLRDQWNPLGRKDRGFFLVFAPVTTALLLIMAVAPLSFWSLVAGMLILGVSFHFIGAAYAGLIALVAQERLMSGRLAVLWQSVATLPVMLSAFGGGLAARYLHPQQTFLILAGFNVAFFVIGLWKPAAVFRGLYDAPQASRAHIVADLKRLVRHRAIYAPVLFWLLFSFAPGSTTPLQYYFSEHLHAPDSLFGLWTGIFAAAFLPTFLLYGWLCTRMKFGTLLFWSTLISVPQMVPMLFIATPAQSLWAAAVIGLMGGLVTAAIYDLGMRSCPPGLQGTLMMMLAAAYALAVRLGDLLGVQIYQASPRYGFLYCVIAITIVYALQLPVIWLVPKHIRDSREGQPDAQGDREMMAEIAEATASV
ncbi:MAG TPA: MFS transporter [Caulobacteraceae bacterium]|jgi:MFS family permease|nr:MFS transporter [Caulobacteraceae bacterium]